MENPSLPLRGHRRARSVGGAFEALRQGGIFENFILVGLGPEDESEVKTPPFPRKSSTTSDVDDDDGSVSDGDSLRSAGTSPPAVSPSSLRHDASSSAPVMKPLNIPHRSPTPPLSTSPRSLGSNSPRCPPGSKFTGDPRKRARMVEQLSSSDTSPSPIRSSSPSFLSCSPSSPSRSAPSRTRKEPKVLYTYPESKKLPFEKIEQFCFPEGLFAEVSYADSSMFASSLKILWNIDHRCLHFDSFSS